MAEYLFTGAFPRVMFGLSQAVNAWHTPADGTPSGLAEGQTIVLNPGDRIRLDGDDYPHPELVLAPADETPATDEEEPPADPPAPTKPARNGTKA